jgi:hypothetical protein
MVEVNSTSTLAQMLFAGKPAINFAHVVRELDQALARYPSTQRSLSWDCDDLAIFDLDGARIVLSYADDLPGAKSACLTLGIGPGSAGHGASPLEANRAALCRKITDRLAERYEVDAVLWHDSDQPVTADLIDTLVSDLAEAPNLAELSVGGSVERLLARMDAEMDSRDTPPPMNFARPEPDSDLGPALLHGAPAHPANQTPDLPRPRNAELALIREALYSDDPAPVRRQQSAQMRLAVHAMNATMVVVFLPVGMAAMAHGIVRGEDMRRSAQMMAVLGLFTAALGGHGMSGLGLL